MNHNRAKQLLEKLYSIGVRDFVICPGGRNAPFVNLLEKCTSKDIRVHWGFEERSASFLGLGLSMRNQEPVAIFTTSGTAFVETASALLEAHYSGLPLIVVSSDRPEEQWGTGAPQTLMQKDFLYSHLGPSVDENFNSTEVSYPLHVNCCFDEPLIDKDLSEWSFALSSQGLKTELKLNEYKIKFKHYETNELKKFLLKENIDSNKDLKILILVTGVTQNFKADLGQKLKSIKADVFFEATGEVSEHPSQINSRQINNKHITENYDFVVRLGGIPTHRVWRDFEIKKYKKILHFSNLPLPGLSGGHVYKLTAFDDFLKDLSAYKLKNTIPIKSEVDSKDLTEEERFFSVLKQKINDQTVIYLGNSLPIRNWDLDKKIKSNLVFASRGLNGIDGQLSTAIGLAMKYANHKVIAVLGDLTALYDLSSPWYWLKNKSHMNLTVVIVNNSGGQIFSKMFDSPAFINEHNLDFHHWAEMWGLSYKKINLSSELGPIEQLPNILEFKPEKVKKS